MARFTAVVDVAAPAVRVWAALVDWPAHGRWAPLTEVRLLSADGVGVGARFAGRTGVGPLAVDDPMEITEWRPPAPGSPGRCRVSKQGRVVLGEAWFEVAEAPGGRSRVTWSEDIFVVSPLVSRPLRPLIVLAGRLAFTWMLRRMAAEVEAGGSDG